MVKLCRQASGPIVVTLSLVVSENLSWTAHVHGQMVNPAVCCATSHIPPVLTLELFKALVLVLTTNNICAGHSDSTFVEMAETRGGKFLSQRKEVVSYLDKHLEPCIRHKECELLVKGAIVCSVCENYRSNLRAMYSSYTRKNKRPIHSKTNLRYMSSHQKRARMLQVKAALHNKRRQLERVRKKVAELTEKQGVEISDDLSGDFNDVIKDHDEEIKKLPANSFKRVFWEQQVSNNKLHKHAVNVLLQLPRCRQNVQRGNQAEDGILCLCVGA